MKTLMDKMDDIETDLAKKLDNSVFTEPEKVQTEE